MGDTKQAFGDTLLVSESQEKPLFSEDDLEMPGVDIPAANETAATASNTAADTALGDDAPEDVDFTLSDVLAPEGDPADDDQQVGGTRSSAESTDCGSDGDKHGDDDEEDAMNEEKMRQRGIKRIVRQRRREIEETKDALRAMEASMATLQLQAQPLPPPDALPEHDLMTLPSTTTDWERAADEVAKWLKTTEDVHILQVTLDTEMKYGQSRRTNSARLLQVKKSFRRNGLLRLI